MEGIHKHLVEFLQECDIMGRDRSLVYPEKAKESRCRVRLHQNFCNLCLHAYVYSGIMETETRTEAVGYNDGLTKIYHHLNH